ncbi:UNKNOWN [Stylonychia lemnae]|uniref:Uncharacterized protein n=1 Tax=Stylonychia lemnae TaxID=5949 RepID=A0A078ATN1_STYLE|nr:UNKNOWN [Stylonychia lemnae]|eukprot:CDW85785.1 UNKNOWN [Stylonychia lemnae]
MTITISEGDETVSRNSPSRGELNQVKMTNYIQDQQSAVAVDTPINQDLVNRRLQGRMALSQGKNPFTLKNEKVKRYSNSNNDEYVINFGTGSSNIRSRQFNQVISNQTPYNNTNGNAKDISTANQTLISPIQLHNLYQQAKLSNIKKAKNENLKKLTYSANQQATFQQSPLLNKEQNNNQGFLPLLTQTTNNFGKDLQSRKLTNSQVSSGVETTTSSQLTQQKLYSGSTQSNNNQGIISQTPNNMSNKNKVIDKIYIYKEKQRNTNNQSKDKNRTALPTNTRAIDYYQTKNLALREFINENYHSNKEQNQGTQMNLRSTKNSLFSKNTVDFQQQKQYLQDELFADNQILQNINEEMLRLNQYIKQKVYQKSNYNSILARKADEISLTRKSFHNKMKDKFQEELRAQTKLKELNINLFEKQRDSYSHTVRDYSKFKSACRSYSKTIKYQTPRIYQNLTKRVMQSQESQNLDRTRLPLLFIRTANEVLFKDSIIPKFSKISVMKTANFEYLKILSQQTVSRTMRTHRSFPIEISESQFISFERITDIILKLTRLTPLDFQQFHQNSNGSTHHQYLQDFIGNHHHHSKNQNSHIDQNFTQNFKNLRKSLDDLINLKLIMKDFEHQETRELKFQQMKVKVELQKTQLQKNSSPEPIQKFLGKTGIELYYSTYNELNMQNTQLKNQLNRYFNEYYSNKEPQDKLQQIYEDLQRQIIKSTFKHRMIKVCAFENRNHPPSELYLFIDEKKKAKIVDILAVKQKQIPQQVNTNPLINATISLTLQEQNNFINQFTQSAQRNKQANNTSNI